MTSPSTPGGDAPKPTLVLTRDEIIDRVEAFFNEAKRVGSGSASINAFTAASLADTLLRRDQQNFAASIALSESGEITANAETVNFDWPRKPYAPTDKESDAHKALVHEVCDRIKFFERNRQCLRCAPEVETPHGKGVPGCYAAANETVSIVMRAKESVAPSAGERGFDQEALDRASMELQGHFGREGSIYGIKACEEIARIALTAYGTHSAREECAGLTEAHNICLAAATRLGASANNERMGGNREAATVRDAQSSLAAQLAENIRRISCSTRHSELSEGPPTGLITAMSGAAGISFTKARELYEMVYAADRRATDDA